MSSWVRYTVAVYIGFLLSGTLGVPQLQDSALLLGSALVQVSPEDWNAQRFAPQDAPDSHEHQPPTPPITPTSYRIRTDLQSRAS